MDGEIGHKLSELQFKDQDSVLSSHILKIIYLIGQPGSGKSTLTKNFLTSQCTLQETRTEPFKHELYDYRGTTILSLGIQNSKTFGGTDVLPFTVITQIKEWLPTVPPDTIIVGEGDRLANEKFFEEAKKCGDLCVVWLKTTDDVASERRRKRSEMKGKKLQNEAWIKGRITKTKRIASSYDPVVIDGQLPLEEQIDLLKKIIRGVSKPNLKKLPVRVYHPREVLTSEDLKNMSGEFLTLNESTCVINDDADVYKPNGEVLLKFRKSILPPDMCDNIFVSLKSAARKNDNRGIAAGKFNINEFKERMDTEGKEIQKKVFKYKQGKFKAHYKNQTIANQVRSGIVGWSDYAPRDDPDRKGCRLTRFSAKFLKRYERTFPFFEFISDRFGELMPEQYMRQKERIEKSRGRIGTSVFSTVTVNYNWRTALHTDKGDYPKGFGCFTVLENPSRQESFGGCELFFPRYNIAVDVRGGSLLLFDSHEYHCNNEATFSETKERVSLVCYLRTNMLSACSKNEPHREKYWKCFKLRLQYRPEDEQEMQEVCRGMIFKRNQVLRVEEGDRWLDYGAGIGCFANWAANLGAAQVISVQMSEDSDPQLFHHNIHLNMNEEVIVLNDPLAEFSIDDPITCVKIDVPNRILLKILQTCTSWKNVQKIVFRYWFSKGDTWEDFIENTACLHKHGFSTYHSPIPDVGVVQDMDYLMVYAKKRSTGRPCMMKLKN